MRSAGAFGPLQSIAMKLLTQEEPLFVAGAAAYPYSDALAERCERFTRFGEPYSMGLKVGNRYYLPRNAVPAGGKDYRCDGKDVQIPMSSSFSLRNDAQKRIASGLEENLQASQEGFILQAGTGTGKTIMSIYGASLYGKSTLIVVDQQNIMDQWLEALLKVTDLTREEIGFWYGDVEPDPECKVVIAMVHSICKVGRYDPEIYQRFGLAIFDEVHVMAADSFVNACFLIPARMRVGLSATVERQDGRSDLLFAHIGEIRIVEDSVPLSPKVLVVPTAYKIPLRREMDPVTNEVFFKQVPHSGGRAMGVTRLMVRDADRNALIVKFVKMAREKGRNVVVFSDIRDKHLLPLKSLLIKASIPKDDIGVFVGGMKKAAQEDAKRKPVVLTTYKNTEKAVDCPWWDTAILTTPRSDVRQTIGRVLRESPTKRDVNDGSSAGLFPLVVDLVDVDSPIFRGFLSSRLKYYRSIKAQIFGPDNLIGAKS